MSTAVQSSNNNNTLPTNFSSSDPQRGQVGKLLLRPKSSWNPPLPRCHYCATAAIPGLCPAVRRPAEDDLEREASAADDDSRGRQNGGAAGTKKRKMGPMMDQRQEDCFVPMDKPKIEIRVEMGDEARETKKEEEGEDVEMKVLPERLVTRREALEEAGVFFPGELIW
ncbi:hypothetical protein RQP46_005409 [Phenoliferia psychrophenolica]